MKLKTSLKLATCVAAAITLSACKDEPKQEKKTVDLTQDSVKEAYVIGYAAGENMIKNIDGLDGTGITVDIEALLVGYSDGVKKSNQLTDEDVKTIMNEFRQNVNTAMQEKRKKEQEQQAEEAKANIEKGAAFLEENKSKEGVKTTESGLQYKVLKEGTGKQPKASDRVRVHYTGTLIDGSEFDSSRKRGQPSEFGLSQVIAGWTEGLQLMKEGAQYQFFIPSQLGYGAQSRPNMPGNSVLIFDVELLEIIDMGKKAEDAKKAPPPAPKGADAK